MILGIESSCDESALALFDPQSGIIEEYVHSQLDLHKAYGGVVPDIASREHLENFYPLLKCLQSDLNKVNKIAVTCGPGLAGCLALGVAFAKSLSLSLKAPLFGVNHLRGHAYSPFIGLHKESPKNFEEKLSTLLPHLGMLVSGGNTLLFKIDEQKQISIIARTVDDAAGEALDKGAKLLGMPYPGGPMIEASAQKGDPKQYDFPRAFPQRSEMKYSFSGLKTSLRYKLEEMDDETLSNNMPDIAASYQAAVIGQLCKKMQHALDKEAYKSVGLSGGVANNGTLRNQFQSIAEKKKLPAFIAEKKHTGDNAAMIAFAAYADEGNTLGKEKKLSFFPSIKLG